MTSSVPGEWVQTFLKSRLENHQQPLPNDLLRLLGFLIPSLNSNTSACSQQTLEKEVHWFCSKVDSQLIKDLAGYLLFCFAFSPTDETKLYYDHLKRCVGHCQGCARGFCGARGRFAPLYLKKAYPEPTQLVFNKEIDKWQATTVLEAVEAVSNSPGPSKPSTFLGLSTPYLQLLFGLPDGRIFSDPRIKPRVVAAILAQPNLPLGHAGKVCKQLVQMGLLPGLLDIAWHALQATEQDRQNQVRDWAEHQIRGCGVYPLVEGDWDDLAFGTVWTRLITDEAGGLDERDRQNDEFYRWRVVQETLESGAIGRTCLEERILLKARKKVVAVIAGKLTHSTHLFPLLVRALSAILSISPTALVWDTSDTSPQFAYTVWANIRDHPEFNKLLAATLDYQNFQRGSEAIDSVIDRLNTTDASRRLANQDPETRLAYAAVAQPYTWALDWFAPFVESVHAIALASLDFGIFEDVLAKSTNFCLESLQHPRYTEGTRKRGFEVGANLLQRSLALRYSASGESRRPTQDILFKVMEINGPIMVSMVVNLADHPPGPWKRARDACLRVLYTILMEDGMDAKETVAQLALLAQDARKRKTNEGESFHQLKIHKQVWAKVYESQPATVDTIGLLMRGLVRFAHVATPEGRPWSYDELSFWKETGAWGKAVTSAVRSMQAMRDGFQIKVNGFTELNDPNVLVSLWSTPRVPEAVIRLLLCPDEGVHEGVIALVAQAFSIDGRTEGIRTLLESYPAQTVSGLNDYLDGWIKDAPRFTSMMESARWLVRCFSDIMEVLCEPSIEHTPMLKSTKFLATKFQGSGGAPNTMQSAIRLLWTKMAEALRIIVRDAREWSRWHEFGTMVAWMRDALIFGNHMVQQIRTFEGAATFQLQESFPAPLVESPRKLTSVGAKMVTCMEPLLGSLVAWLQITHVELLHQAFQLVSDLLDCLSRHHASKAPLSEGLEDTLWRLRRLNKATAKHKLTQSQLAELTSRITRLSGEQEEEEQGLDDQNGDEPEILEIAPKPRHKDSSRPRPPAQRDAFAEMMSQSQKGRASMDPRKPSQPKPRTPLSSEPIEIPDSDEDDEFSELADPFAGLSAAQLVQLDKGKGTSKSTAIPSGTQRQLVDRARLRVEATKAGQSAPRGAASRPSKPKGVLGQLKQQTREQKQALVRLPPSRITSSAPTAGPSKPPAPRVIPRQVEKPDSESESSGDDRSGPGLGALKALEVATLVQPHRPAPKMKAAMPKVAPAAIVERQTAEQIQRRLRPDLTDMFRRILRWDPRDTNVPAFPLKRIPGSFSGTKQYHTDLAPLFFRGLWEEVRTKTEERSASDSISIQVVNRQNEDDWLVLDVAPAAGLPQGWRLSENDLAILTSKDGKYQLFAKVDKFNAHGKNVMIKVRVHVEKEVPGLSTQGQWTLRKHLNLVTARREYAGLKSLPSLERPIIRGVIQGLAAKLPQVSSEEVQQAIKDFNVNEPQAKAILGAMRIEGFALIQGPPGTGKTKTISGLVGKFLADRDAISRAGRQGEIQGIKLMVCAPSNAAIDEVTRRLKMGVQVGGKLLTPTIVRLGSDASMHPSVVDVSLDALIEVQLATLKADRDKGASDISRAESALDEIRKKREATQAKLQELGDDNDELRRELDKELHGLVAQRVARARELNLARDEARDYGRQMNAAKREAAEKIMQKADIICSTLSGAGHDSLTPYDFGTVIIDEAAQAIEMSTLIPLKYRCRRCILVGDPQQLPPTVISQEISSLGYNESLFVRLCKDRPDAMHLLSIQYRMHPDISMLPSKIFYDSKLTDGPGMAEKTVAPWHATELFGTYRFFNVEGAEASRGNSKINEHQIEAIVALYRGLRELYGGSDKLFGKIGVIATYKEQVNALRNRFRQSFYQEAFDDIDFNTVDAFQGQEKAIIILSTVRAGADLQSIGFVKDRRRMNVALTRAKSSLFVFGEAGTLERINRDWQVIVGNARDRGFLVQYQRGIFQELGPSKVVPARITNGKQSKNLAAPGPVPKQVLEKPADAKASKRAASPASSTDTDSEPDHKKGKQVLGKSKTKETEEDLAKKRAEDLRIRESIIIPSDSDSNASSSEDGAGSDEMDIDSDSDQGAPSRSSMPAASTGTRSSASPPARPVDSGRPPSPIPAAAMRPAPNSKPSGPASLPPPASTPNAEGGPVAVPRIPSGPAASHGQPVRPSVAPRPGQPPKRPEPGSLFINKPKKRSHVKGPTTYDGPVPIGPPPSQAPPPPSASSANHGHSRQHQTPSSSSSGYRPGGGSGPGGYRRPGAR